MILVPPEKKAYNKGFSDGFMLATFVFMILIFISI